MDKQEKLLARLFKDTFIIFLLSAIAATLGNIIDGMITGNFLGTEAIAAFGLTVPYQKFTAIFPQVVALGMQILCSKSLGAGNLQECNKIFSLALTTTLSVAVLMTSGTWLFDNEIADSLGATEDHGLIRTEAIDYLCAYSLSFPAIALVVTLTPIMQLDSDRRRAVVAVAAMSVCNVAGDLLNIFVLDGGLFGIGIATAVSYWLSAGVLILHFFKPEASFAYTHNFDIDFFGKMMLNGSPVFIGRILSTLRVAFLIRLALTLAAGSGIAAYTIVTNFAGILETIPKALGSSAQIIGSILVGEQDKHSVRRMMSFALKFALAITLPLSALLPLTAPIIAELYTENDPRTFQLTIDGIYLFALSLPLWSMGYIFQLFYQSYGRFKLVNVLAAADNFFLFVPTAYLLSERFGIAGLWLTFPINSLEFVTLIFGITCYFHGRITFKLEDYLLLPKDFDVPEDKQLDITVTSKDEVLDLSERTQTFCESHGIDTRRSMFAGVCIEEMAGNIVDYGFGDGKKHFVDIRVIVNGDRIIIRIRDDCRPFDPKKQVELLNPGDPASHIGIRLVRKMATNFEYVNVLKLNNLIIKL